MKIRIKQNGGKRENKLCLVLLVVVVVVVVALQKRCQICVQKQISKELTAHKKHVVDLHMLHGTGTFTYMNGLNLWYSYIVNLPVPWSVWDFHHKQSILPRKYGLEI